MLPDRDKNLAASTARCSEARGAKRRGAGPGRIRGAGLALALLLGLGGVASAEPPQEREPAGSPWEDLLRARIAGKGAAGRVVEARPAVQPLPADSGAGAQPAGAAPSTPVIDAGPPEIALVSGPCAGSVRDQADPGSCLQASSAPALGTLYPLGPEFNIDPTGRVGLGTLAPQHTLDVAGDARVSGRLAVGNDALIGPWTFFDQVVDLSATIGSFVPGFDWTPLRSYYTFDPSLHLTGPNEHYLYSHDLAARTPVGNPFDFKYVQGPYLSAGHYGDGTVDILGGLVVDGFATAGKVQDLYGAAIFSMAAESATAVRNTGLAVTTGHFGPDLGGEVIDDTSILIETPFKGSPVQNHYGIYLEDQEIASGKNYAIYSAGGAHYFKGNVGIGTEPSNYALQVGNLGDGSEARANAWNLLSSREYKRDIEALSPEECRDILSKIEAVDVVRYRYADDDYRHLGVIAEDSPKEILSRDGQGVSLGDYSAFLLAGLKAQQAELSALRAEVEALKARGEPSAGGG